VGNDDTLGSDGDHLFSTISLPATSRAVQTRERRGVKERLVCYSLQKLFLLFFMWDDELMYFFMYSFKILSHIL
jgi:hypothetical protein